MATQIGWGTQVFMDGVDLTFMLNKAALASPGESKETTVFRTPQYARTYIAGLKTSTLQLSGPQPMKEDEVLRMVKASPVARMAGQDVLVCPGGATVGNLALFLKSLQTSWKTDEQTDGVIQLSSDYQATAQSPGLCAGAVLTTPNGVTNIQQGDRQVITLGSAARPASISDELGHTFALNPTDTAAVVQAAARVMSGDYASVVVTGSSTITPGTDLTNTGPAQTWPNGTVTGGEAIDNNNATVVAFGNAGENYFNYDFGTATPIQAWSMRLDGPYSTPTGVAGEVRLYGKATAFSGAGAGGGTLISTQANLSWTTDEKKVWTVPAGTSYRYYRIYAPAVSCGTTFNIEEIELIDTAVVAGSYTFTFPAAADSVALMTTGSAGYDITRTRTGGTFAMNVLSGTGNGTTLKDYDTTTVTAHGGDVAIQVLEVAGSPSLTVQLQHAPDSAGSAGTFVDLGSPLTMTDVGAYRIAIADGVSVNPWLRLKITAITGTFVIAAAFARRF